MTDLKNRAKEFLTTRKQSYARVFNPESIYAQRVLADLAKFCRANASTFHENPAIANRLDGRREVWLRIQQHLNLSPDQLYHLFGGNEKP